jgi:hypothetical protein
VEVETAGVTTVEVVSVAARPELADAPGELRSSWPAVQVSLARDHAVYVEANVWMRHRLR